MSRAVRAAAPNPLPACLEPEHSFLLDLDFDSLSISALTLALEEEFERRVLLVEWIQESGDPTELTVGSLCDYIEGLL